MDIPSLFPQWRSLWINPYSRTTQQYPLGQLLLSLAEEVEKEARKYGRDWRLQETGRQYLIDVSTELSQFLVQTGNAVIEKLPTVTFLFGDHPLQHRSTGRFLFGVACTMVDKAQTFCNPQQHLHYKLRMKIRQILLSVADIFETAARALWNPVNPFDLPGEDSSVSDSRPRPPPPPLRKNVDMMTEDVGAADRAGNESRNKEEHESGVVEAVGDLNHLSQTEGASNLEISTRTRSETVVEKLENVRCQDGMNVSPATSLAGVCTKTTRNRGRPKRKRTQSKSSDKEEDDLYSKVGTPFSNEAEATPHQFVKANSPPPHPQAVKSGSFPQQVVEIGEEKKSPVASTPVGIESVKNRRVATRGRAREVNSQNATTERRFSQRLRH